MAGEKLTVLTAASGKDVASWGEKARHGMFTHHLLDALYGRGDLDDDGWVTASEAKTYLDDTMTVAARVEFGRYQNASLNGLTDAVLARAGDGGAFPPRPRLGGDDERKGGDEVVPPPPPPVETAKSEEKALDLTYAERVLVQHGLASLGHDVGVADGVFGRRTRSGIRSYQRKKGLSETGYLTDELRDALVVAGELHAESARRSDDEVAERARLLNESGKMAGATALGAVIGATVGRNIGRHLDEISRQRAGAATHEALETADVGESITWANPDNAGGPAHGSATVTREGADSEGRICREFQQTVIVGVREDQSFKVACRDENGAWQIVSS